MIRLYTTDRAHITEHFSTNRQERQTPANLISVRPQVKFSPLNIDYELHVLYVRKNKGNGVTTNRDSKIYPLHYFLCFSYRHRNFKTSYSKLRFV